MKRNVILVIGWLSGAVLLPGCQKEEEVLVNKECEPVPLISDEGEGWFEKEILLFEDQEYLIKAPLSLVISDLNEVLIHYEEYLKVVDQIVTDAKEQDKLKISDYFSDEQKDYLIAHVLETGHCYVYSKKSSAALAEVCVEKYSCPGPLSGQGGRRLFLNDQLFLEVIDYVC